MPYRKNVFLIGAGASRHANAPLMANFLEAAESILNTGRLDEEEARRFRNVLDYRRDRDVGEQRAGLDLTNIEDLFGLADMHARLDMSKSSLRKDLVFMTLRTLELEIQDEVPTVVHIMLRRGTGMEGLGFEGTISKHFVNIVARRWEDPPTDPHTKDVIISLNYDPLIEQALLEVGILPDYCLPVAALQYAHIKRMKLLKLHGSSNWGACSKCGRLSVLRLKKKMLRSLLATTCDDCDGVLEPFIVPPTWNKGEHHEALNSVWKAAFQELLGAQRLVLIGTSLPETDRFLRYLFALVLEQNKTLDRLLIINPEPNLEKLYGNLFRNFPKRVQIKSLGKCFEEIVCSSQLHAELGQEPVSQQNTVW